MPNSYHPNDFQTKNENSMLNPIVQYASNNSNLNKNLQTIYPSKDCAFDFELEKAFIRKQKQWLNLMSYGKQIVSGPQPGNTVTKPGTSSYADQKKNKVQFDDRQQNLAKTVKHSIFSYKKNQQINLELFKPSSIYLSNPKNIEQNFLGSNQQEDYLLNFSESFQKHVILSIDQIRQIQKNSFNDKIIHKIASSRSRNKLKSSSSKDSKDSIKFQNKSNQKNSNSNRFDKYIHKELINIDLEKQIPPNIIAPNLNPRKIRANEPIGFFDHPAKSNYPSFQVSSQIQAPAIHNSQAAPAFQAPQSGNQQQKFSQNNQLTCQQSVPRQDFNFFEARLKTRSKSNLSKYSQLKNQNQNQKQCLRYCQEVKAQIKSSEEVFMDINKTSIEIFDFDHLDKNKRKVQVFSHFPANDNFSRKNLWIDGHNKHQMFGQRQHKIKTDGKIPVQSIEQRNFPISSQKENPLTERKSLGFYQPKFSVQSTVSNLGQILLDKIKKSSIKLTIQKNI